MDPQACLHRLLEAIRAKDHTETVQASSDLLCWYLRGSQGAASEQEINAIGIGLADAADALENDS